MSYFDYKSLQKKKPEPSTRSAVWPFREAKTEQTRVPRARATVDRGEQKQRRDALLRASKVVRAVHRGADPSAELAALQQDSPEEFEAVLRALSSAPGTPAKLRTLLREPPAQEVPARS